MYSAGPIVGNHLRFRVNPDVSLSLGMMVMAPGEDLIGQPVELLGSRRPVTVEADAYERVLGDAIEGDTTLFARADYVDEAWRIVDPVLKSPSAVYEYDANSWGPAEADGVSPAGGWHNPVVDAPPA
jgi:glucose-6-phosphate 1-dehydrogenase